MEENRQQVSEICSQVHFGQALQRFGWLPAFLVQQIGVRDVEIFLLFRVKKVMLKVLTVATLGQRRLIVHTIFDIKNVVIFDMIFGSFEPKQVLQY